MLAFSRHFKDASITPVCSMWELDGAVGGNSMLWRTVGKWTTRESSLVVLPQLPCADNHKITCHSSVVHPEVKMTAVCLRTDDDAQSAIKRAVDVNRRKYPSSRHRLVVFESATTLSLLQSFETLVTALFQCSVSPHVQGVIALFQADAFSQREIDQIRKMCSCNFLLKPATSLNSDLALATTGHRMHVAAVSSMLRHSGRVRVDQSEYSMMASGHLRCFVNRHLDGKLSDGRQACGGERDGEQLQSKFEADMSGFMKLTLSARDKQQRKGVVLPWQHDGLQSNVQDQSVITSAVHYVRDSDNDCDSDEDPDDDLDL